MKRILRLIAAVGLMVFVLASGGESRAAISTTLAGWAANSVTLAPVTWTYTGPTNLSTSTPVTFSQVADSNILALDFTSAPLAAGTYTLGYNISLAPGYVFTSAAVSATLAGDPQSAVVTETGTSLNLATTGTNGGANDTTSIAELTAITVTETFSVTAGEIVSVADTFDTAPVPEPASILVWGLLGACGIGASLWRSNRRAA